jgi:aminoglycoside phosphotransferase (APT) family kinase protein
VKVHRLTVQNDAVETTAPTAVGGNRLLWPDLPADIRAAIEQGLGARVEHAESREGGFSPGLASALTLDDGRSVFVKACSFARNDFSPVALRREAEVLPQLPASVPAPRVVWHYDDGEWVILAADMIEGSMPDATRFLHAAGALPDLLTPAPFAASSLTAEYADEFQQWSTLPADWAADRRAELVALEAGWTEASRGDTLLHGDLRPDNVLVTADGFAVVDWSSVVVGVRWFDLLMALPSITMAGGGDPEELWSAQPLSREADPDAVDAVLAGAAAFFLGRSLQPPVPLLPTIRRFQYAQGAEVMRWLASRRGWDDLRSWGRPGL